MPLRVVLFELTGVLLDEWGNHAAMDAAMGAARARFSLAEAPEELSGEFSLRLMDLIAAEPPPAPAEEEATEAPAEFQPYETVARELFLEMLDTRGFAPDPAHGAWFWDALVAAHREHARAHADAHKTLRALQEEDLRLGVVTDTDPALAAASLDAAGLAGFLDHIVTSRDAGYVKPSVKLFEHALARFPGVAPAQALMVGASYERDVLGAQRAGLRGVLVDRHDARLVPKGEKVTSLRKLMPLVRGMLL